jgi:hypothetical protein
MRAVPLGIGSAMLVVAAIMSIALPGAGQVSAASDSPAPSASAPTPSPAPSGHDEVIGVGTGLWGSVAPDEIPVSYACEAPDTFTAAEWASAPPPDEVSPPIPISSVADPEESANYADWRVIDIDEERALVVAARHDNSRASQQWPVYYVQMARMPTGWLWEGEGNCRPRARFPETSAGGGFWRLDDESPLPEPDSRSLHIKVWDDRECRSSVEIRGEPIVKVTETAVLISIPVAGTSVGDMCTPGRPTRLKVELPEPLGDREVYDIGALPLRSVLP